MQKRMGWILLLSFTLVPAALLFGFQMRYNQKYEWEMQDPVEDPPDALVKGEFTFARLRYRSFQYGGRYWRRSSWGIDSNRADRLFSQDRKSTRLNSSHIPLSRMPSSA